MNFKRVAGFMLVALLLFSCSQKKEEKSVVKERIYDNIKQLSKAGKEASEKIAKKAKDIIPEKKEEIKEQAVKKAKKSKAKLWDIYKETKQKIKDAKMQERFNELIDLLKKEAKISEELGRKDIQAWQLNNIGYYSIEEFKKKINYDQTMAQIYATKDKKKRKELYDKLKIKMKKNYYLLRDSYDYLLKAKKISSQNNDEKQKKVIANNIAFINDIKKMIEKAEKK